MPPVLISLLLACVQTVPKPDLGACAAPSAAGDTYGEIGIGTCLAGPTDIAFTEVDGRSYLAVVNANPFMNFGSGSLALIAWDSLDLGARVNTLDQVEAYALQLDNYVGGLGILQDRSLALVTSRFTEASADRTGRDPVYVVDLSTPSQMSLWPLGSDLLLEDDPMPIAVDAAHDRAYIGNLTDHSVSVLNTSATPLSLIDASGDGAIAFEDFLDADASGSHASLYGLTVDNPEELTSDLWTLTWADGTWRIWVPFADGVRRYSTGGGDLVAAGTGLELAPNDIYAELRDPFFGTLTGSPALYFADGDAIRMVVGVDETVGAWDGTYASTPLLRGADWDAEVGGPTVIAIEEQTVLFYHGRASEGEGASLGVAVSNDGWNFTRGYAPFLIPPDGFVSVEHPIVTRDPFSGRWALWVSLYDGAQWSLGRAESDSGTVWGEIEEVWRLEGEDIAAPWLEWANGRYTLFAAHRAGPEWELVRSWSYDGDAWADPEVLLADLGADLPRAAVQSRPEGSWSLTGRDAGAQSAWVTAGEVWSSASYGFSFQVTSGQAWDNPEEVESVLPGSAVALAEGEALYATHLDAGGGSKLALYLDGALVTGDLLPEVLNPSMPVVGGTEGAWVLYYTAPNELGVGVIFRATSADGLNWTAGSTPVFAALADWESLGQEAHSLRRTEDGLWELWYAGYDGSRWRIGAAWSADGAQFTALPGAEREWQLSPGYAGDFDDTGVRDPLIAELDGVLHLWYAGSGDGESWSIGHAIRGEDGGWVRDRDAATGAARAALGAVEGTFAHAGARAPVLRPSRTLYLAGNDGYRTQVGEAVGDQRGLYPAHAFPTSGDALTVRTTAGTTGTSPIPLDQTVEGRTVRGTGLSTLYLDEARGFLFTASKLSNQVIALDVRDDSTDTWTDANYLDIEGVLTVESDSNYFGFRDLLRRPGTDLLYGTTRFPDGIQVLDTSVLVDDDAKQVYVGRTVGDLALTTITNSANYATDDAGVDTQAKMAGAGMALNGDTLLVTHFRGNGLAVFDLGLGTYGQEVAWVPNLGENPHKVIVSPDGKYAIVANYVGEVTDNVVSSTLAVVDIDPDSDTYLEVLTWLANRE